MTERSVAQVETFSTPSESGETPTSGLRWLYRAAIVIAISPIWIAAIRNGLNQWVPIHDAATTALRARDVFSTHPPLLGLAAQPSSGDAQHFSYFGPLELYLLAVPVRLLGVTWGVLLGMATINSACGIAFVTLMRRRVGTVGAIVACAFFASLVWTAGSQVIVDLTPVVMGVIPMATLMIAAWSAADGDDAGLFVLVVVANYLFQGHMKFVIVVPVLTVFGLAGWWLHTRRNRRNDEIAWVARRRERRRWLWAAGIFTVAVWIPPLVEQFGSSQGNLTKIVSATLHGEIGSNQAAHYAPTLHGALGTVVATTAVFPLWLRPSFAHPTFDRYGGGTPFVAAALGLAVLAGAFLALGWWSHRRGDRSMVVGLGMGVVAWVAWLVTATRNPGHYGFDARYFHGLWPLSMVLWLLVVLGLMRRLPSVATGLTRRLVGVGAAALTLTAAIATVPYANFGSGSPEYLAIPARAVRDIVTHDVPRDGPVLVTSSGTVGRQLLPSALLALQHEGVPFRMNHSFDVQQYGADRAFNPLHPNATTTIVIHDYPSMPPPGFHQVVKTAPLPGTFDAVGFQRADAQVRDWLTKVQVPKIAATFPIGAARRARFDTGFAKLADKAADGKFSILDLSEFNKQLRKLERVPGHVPLDVPGLSPTQFHSWVAAKKWQLAHRIYVDIGPVR